MSEAEILSQVKIRLGITGAYQDDLLTAYIHDVKDFLIDAGVPLEIVESNASLGVISRGVSDTWNYGSGDGEYSKMFFQRVGQLVRADIAATDAFGELVERVEDIETFLNGKTFLTAD